jgi:hypothetical protein
VSYGEAIQRAARPYPRNKMENISNWMAWEGGVDLVAVTDPSFEQPNVIVHVARMVHTPVGSSASGMILWMPDPATGPAVMGFVSGDPSVGAYFGPKIFAGTPFEGAPALEASIQITTSETSCNAVVKVGGHVFEVSMKDLGPQHLISREPGGFTPFTQQGIEAKPGSVTLKVNGEEVQLYIPEVGITGGPGAVVSPAGVYAR